MPSRLLIALLLALVAPLTAAQDAYFDVALADLDIGDETLPLYPEDLPWQHREQLGIRWPYAFVEGDGEAYFVYAREWNHWGSPGSLQRGRLVVRAPEGRDLRGTLVVPTADWSRMVRLAFILPATVATAGAERTYQRARARHYEALADASLSGGAWWRHRAHLARAALEHEESRNGTSLRPDVRWSYPLEMEDTYALFSGGRAVSENLQLDRLLPEAAEGGELVNLDSIEGITISEMDWTTLLGDAQPELDPLAAFVPADQHALFFPTFEGLVSLADEAAEFGAPVLAAFAESARDLRTRERYEEQLCLELDAWARRLGGMAIESVAMTGSDPYLRTGSDVAMLYEAKDANLLVGFVRARQAAAREAAGDVAAVEGEVAGVAYTGVVSPSRRVCSYSAVVDDVVIVTNSLHQLERLIATKADAASSMASLDEYRFFRHRYPRIDADESALLIVTDAAIRRWCGPEWRIATSRRTRATAALADLQAEHLATLAAGVKVRVDIESRPDFPVLGNLYLTTDGVHSSKYGTLNFQTPIAELGLTQVTKEEADLYRSWRDGYQRNWSGVFDPIALRFAVADDGMGIDLSVLPLIGNSDYREMIEVVGNALLAPDAGDPHPESLAHFAMALDPESPPLREIGNVLSEFGDEVGANPMSWIGGSAALYFDRDPIWGDLASAESFDELAENLFVDINEIPVLFQVEVSSPLKLAAFLTSLRTMVNGTVPDLLEWETREFGERRYVCITSNDSFLDDVKLFYAALPDVLLISPHEPTLHKAMTRWTTRRNAEEGAEPPPAEPWLGKSVAVKVEADGLRMLQMLIGEDWSKFTCLTSWSNLPILNEWRRLYPDRDPLAVHLDLWGERLLCPGGGEYVWNEAWGTMESTACGHPGEPGTDFDLPTAFTSILRASLGLTFEHDGLRAAVQLKRGK